MARRRRGVVQSLSLAGALWAAGASACLDARFFEYSLAPPAQFSPADFGLDGEPVTSPFGVVRPRDGGCPHKGVDIASGGHPRAFVAGVYGTVLAVHRQGGFNTVSIRPLFSDEALQFLHASKVFVSTGQTVRPWTVVGETGEVGARGGIHLHVQIQTCGPVTAPCAVEREPCWRSRAGVPRDFRDPLGRPSPAVPSSTR